MVFVLGGVLKSEKPEDLLNREATLTRLHGLVVRQIEESPSHMQQMGEKIMCKADNEWEWWKSDFFLK
jgi:uncharacterized protein YfkK (UPF0435 family)